MFEPHLLAFRSDIMQVFLSTLGRDNSIGARSS